MKRRDLSDMHRAGALPRDPFDAVEPVREHELPSARRIIAHDAAKIAEPLPPVSYLVDALGIATGAPVLVAGYGFSGKTVSLQSLALSVASGRDLWGVYRVRRGRVLHLDFEQGTRVSHERYQRLARGMGIDLAELGDRLRLAVNPAAYMDDADAIDVYKRAFEGVDLAIVDSLRAAAPTCDENSSEIRRPIDWAFRAAEGQGTVVVFLLHARKPKDGDGAGARYKIRGSSALFDAGASTFVFAAEKGEPIRVSHEKCRNRGVTVDDFGLRVEDVAIDGEPRAGLRVVHLEGEQLSSAGAARGDYPDAVARVAAFIREQGEYRGSKTSVCKRMRMGTTAFYPAFAELESLGHVATGRDERGQFVRWVGAPTALGEHLGANGSGPQDHSSRSASLGGRAPRAVGEVEP